MLATELFVAECAPVSLQAVALVNLMNKNADGRIAAEEIVAKMQAAKRRESQAHRADTMALIAREIRQGELSAESAALLSTR